MTPGRRARAGAWPSGRRWAEYSRASRPRARSGDGSRPRGRISPACDSGLKMRNHGAASGLRAGHPLPVQRIAGEVRIHQRVPEPALAVAPVVQQVLHRNDAVIMRTRLCMKPVLPQLAHAGIDHRKAGAARFCQARSSRRRRAPGQLLERAHREDDPAGADAAPAAAWRTRARPARRRTCSPRSVSAIGRSALACSAARPDLSWRELAMVQVRRQARVARQVRAITIVRVVRQSLATNDFSALARACSRRAASAAPATDASETLATARVQRAVPWRASARERAVRGGEAGARRSRACCRNAARTA